MGEGKRLVDVERGSNDGRDMSTIRLTVRAMAMDVLTVREAATVVDGESGDNRPLTTNDVGLFQGRENQL